MGVAGAEGARCGGLLSALPSPPSCPSALNTSEHLLAVQTTPSIVMALAELAHPEASPIGRINMGDILEGVARLAKTPQESLSSPPAVGML